MKGPSPEVGMDEIPNRPKVGVSLRGKGAGGSIGLEVEPKWLTGSSLISSRKVTF